MSVQKSSIWRSARQHLIMMTIIFGSWELLVYLLEIPSIVLPPPTEILESLIEQLSTPRFYRHIWVTLSEILGGFVLGTMFGLCLGTIIGLSPLMYRLLYPYIVALESMPKVAIAPIIVVWAGYGIESKIIITALIAFFPLLANTVAGLRSAPRDQVDMLTAFTASRWQIFRMTRLPSALPPIFTGLNIAIVLSVIGAIVGEFVGAREGLGYLILQNNFNFNIAGTFSALIVLSVIGITLHWIVQRIQARVVFWTQSDGSHIGV